MTELIYKTIYVILGIIMGIIIAPIAFVFFTLCLLIIWFCFAFGCLVLPFYMAYEGMNLE